MPNDAPKYACHACGKPIPGDSAHALVNVSATFEESPQEFAYFCPCVGTPGEMTGPDGEKIAVVHFDHAALREDHKRPAPEPAPEAKAEEPVDVREAARAAGEAKRAEVAKAVAAENARIAAEKARQVEEERKAAEATRRAEEEAQKAAKARKAAKA